MRDAFEACHYGGGKCCLIGVAPAGAELSVVPRMLISGRVLMGTAFGNAKSRQRVPELVDWYMDGKIKVDELVTQEIPLEKINWALDEMAKDAAYRFIIKY
jgi:S-(hydroxymethyl)glutathione dehydrogenase/alcohol dehydrogenase